MKFSSDGSIEKLQIEGINLDEPTGVYVDLKGDIYVADRATGLIYKIDNNLQAIIFADVGEGVLGITGDGQGNLFASINTQSGEIKRVGFDGKVNTLAMVPTYVPPNYLVPFISWVGHLTYHREKLYVAGTSTHQIYTVSLDGQVEIFAGTGDKQIPYGDILTADFNRPLGLVFSADGSRLFVSGCEDTVPQHTQASYPSRVYVIDLVN